MAVASSQTLKVGSPAPPFSLQEVSDGRTVTLDDVTGGAALLVAFICRRCPFVVHVQDAFAELAAEYMDKGVSVVAISANDPGESPDDGPEGLAAQKAEVGFDFPYLFDANQSVAKAYHAACTPDFFVFDEHAALAYRGQMDASRPQSDIPVTGQDLRAALDRVLAGEPPLDDQPPSMGCSIKWVPGSEPS